MKVPTVAECEKAIGVPSSEWPTRCHEIAVAINRAFGLGRPVYEDELVEMKGYWKKCFEAFAAKWVKYGEYVTIEFDTDAGTATVVPAGG